MESGLPRQERWHAQAGGIWFRYARWAFRNSEEDRSDPDPEPKDAWLAGAEDSDAGLEDKDSTEEGSAEPPGVGPKQPQGCRGRLWGRAAQNSGPPPGELESSDGVEPVENIGARRANSEVLQGSAVWRVRDSVERS